MIARVEVARFVPRVSPATAVLCATGIAFIAFRLFESPGNPATAFRILMSVAAIAFVLFTRHRSLMQRATLFVVLEAVGGIVAFAYVDVPFVLSHQTQIGMAAATIYDNLHGKPVRHELAQAILPR